MERDLLPFYIMTGFTGVATVALVVQMAMLIGIFRSVKTLQERATKFMDSFEPLAKISCQAVEEVCTQSTEILTRVREMADSTKSQVDKVDGVITDLSASVRAQIERGSQTVDTALKLLDETVAALQNSVLEPARQVRGVMAAVGAVIDYLSIGRQRSTIDRATLDEEMFI